MIYDITPPITPRLAVWPGDTQPTRQVLCDIAQGANITLSTLHATVHLGAHADGPNHYGHPAPGIGERSLEHYLGSCHVVEARVARGKRVGMSDVAWPGGGIRALKHPRLLIRTGTYTDPEIFSTDFAALAPELVEVLATGSHGGARVMTIGIDTPSVDLFESKDLPAHKMFLKHDVAILEGIMLKDVPPGEYELIALPLKLMGFDASPVRAVLRPLK